jgi:hypothetical protein
MSYGQFRRDDQCGPFLRGFLIALDANPLAGGRTKGQDPDAAVEISDGEFGVIELMHLIFTFVLALNSETRARLLPTSF